MMKVKKIILRWLKIAYIFGAFKKFFYETAIPQESVDRIREIRLLAGLKGFSGKGY
jgi:hypothetical protein